MDKKHGKDTAQHINYGMHSLFARVVSSRATSWAERTLDEMVYREIHISAVGNGAQNLAQPFASLR